MMQHNPLLDFSGLPKFDAILPEHVEPALDHLLERNRSEIERLVKEIAQPDWHNFMAPLEQLDDELNRLWSPVSHLNGVRDSDGLRSVYEACLPKLSGYYSELGQHQGLFQKIKTLRESNGWDAMAPAKQKVVTNALRDFRLSGIDLNEEKQQRYREISTELARLSNQFSRNLLDATDAWSVDITSEDRLAGIPKNARELAAQAARSAGVEGWRYNLQGPSYLAAMTYADDADLRQQVYRAYITRASEIGPNHGKWDNASVMKQILALRDEEAQLLGFDNYAALSMETKMAESADQVISFLNQLAEKSLPRSRLEKEELEQFACEQLDMPELSPWDYAWVSEKLRQHRYDFSQETLRPYFPLPKVLDGMFTIVGRLFGIKVTAAPMPQVWHDDVQFFSITDEAGDIRGYFYVDLFARKQKRGGAWMADCACRRMAVDGLQLPVAYLVCNFSTPVADQPSLLTHDEVMTLFHEFGHGLHHMLTKVDVAGVSGISGVPWDAVELPSQFLENWCWEGEALDLISGHIDSGEPLPSSLLEKMRAARNFQSAMQMCRQLEFSLFDMRIHGEEVIRGGSSIQQVLDAVRADVAVVRAPDFNRFQNSFGHVFAGGYAAGYYSYKWAEVLSADAYSLFEEKGVFDASTGRSFLANILEMGGSAEPMALFEAFRGRKPNVDALLRHSGLSSLEVAA